jgi:hypothetical protein
MGAATFLEMDSAQTDDEFFSLRTILDHHRARIEHHVNMIEYPNRYLEAAFLVICTAIIAIAMFWMIFNVTI